MLLWYAEAAVRSGGDLALAKQCLKTVRTRAVTADEAGTVAGVSIDAMSASQLADAAWKEHGWEVGGYWVALATRRSDELRLNHLKENFEYRVKNAHAHYLGRCPGKGESACNRYMERQYDLSVLSGHGSGEEPEPEEISGFTYNTIEEGRP